MSFFENPESAALVTRNHILSLVDKIPEWKTRGQLAMPWETTMLSHAAWLRSFKASNKALLICLRIHIGTTSLLLVLASVAIVGPASALTLYDGEWSVIILTRSGACDPNYRVGVQIAHGEIDSGGFAAVQGQVTSRGGVKVSVRSGNQWAYGSGLLNKNHGRGVWRGRGNSGTCGGTWVAEKHG
jgi:hypothetical protein